MSTYDWVMSTYDWVFLENTSEYVLGVHPPPSAQSAPVLRFRFHESVGLLTSSHIRARVRSWKSNEHPNCRVPLKGYLSWALPRPA